jgi:hypothetical protein
MAARQRGRRRMTWMAISTAVVATSLVVLDVGGCATGGTATTQPLSPSQEQDAALRDPMNYKPQNAPAIDNGDMFHLDVNGLKRDLNDVFNP